MNLHNHSGYQFNYNLFGSENTFSEILDKFNEAFLIISAIRDIRGHITDFILKNLNEAGCKLLNRYRKDVIGQSFLLNFPVYHEYEIFNDLCNVIDTGKIVYRKIEVKNEFENNSIKTYDIRVEKIDDGCILILHDITEIIKLETEKKSDLLHIEKLIADNTYLKENLKIERESFQIALNDLYEAKEYFRIMGEAIPYGIWMSEPDGVIKYVSPSFLKLLDMTIEEVKQFGWFHRLAPEEIGPALKFWQNRIKSEKAWETEYRFLGGNDKYHTVLTRGHPLYHEDGKIKAWVGIHLDIDERKKTEEVLRISESHLINAETLAGLGNYQIEMPGKVFNWSKGLSRILGLDYSERKSDLNDFLNFVHPNDRIYLKACFGQMLYLKTTLENTFRALLSDGSVRYIRNLGKPVIDNSGNLSSIFGVMMDITELKLAELQIKKQKTNAELIAKTSRIIAGAGFDIHKILNVMVEQIAGLIGDGCIIRLISDDGKKVTTVTFYHHDNEILNLINDTFSPGEDDVETAYDQRVIKSGKPVFYPMMDDVKLPDIIKTRYTEFLSKCYIYSGMIVPLKVYGKSIGTITLFRSSHEKEYKVEDLSLVQQLADIAAISILNAQLHQNMLFEVNERKKTVIELEKALVKLERSNKELEQFAYVASHDLQEPIRMVNSYSSLLAKRYKDKLDQDADDFIEFILDGNKRMQMLVSDLLRYSRVTNESKPKNDVNCNEILDSVLTDLQICINEQNAVIKSDSLPTVYGDQVQLRQLFQNLIANALKFKSEKPPEILINCVKKDNDWYFSIKDNGIGIDSEFFEKIFVIFQRLHERDKYPGTGIGLAICKKIVKNHGGSIWVESQPGLGSTFNFSIPVKD